MEVCLSAGNGPPPANGPEIPCWISRPSDGRTRTYNLKLGLKDKTCCPRERYIPPVAPGKPQAASGPKRFRRPCPPCRPPLAIPLPATCAFAMLVPQKQAPPPSYRSLALTAKCLPPDVHSAEYQSAGGLVQSPPLPGPVEVPAKQATDTSSAMPCSPHSSTKRKPRRPATPSPAMATGLLPESCPRASFYDCLRLAGHLNSTWHRPRQDGSHRECSSPGPPRAR